MKPKVPRPPSTLGDAGRAYWKSVQAEFAVEPHQLDLLESACLQLDRAETARQFVERGGLLLPDRFKQLKPNPAVEIERQAHLAFLRISRELGLDISIPESRGPRRPGTRE